MGDHSKIEWTESTWNPVTGCTKVSAGCRNCYAERMARRLQAMGHKNYCHGFRPVVHEPMLELPLKWKRPRVIFVNSMSDLFHKAVSFRFIRKTFDVMRRASHHCFQVLTKRSERLLSLDTKLSWPPNVWAGVSVENEDYCFRIDDLRATQAAVKFVSIEPMLGPIPHLDLSNIDWVIVGGESGPGARPMRYTWVKRVRSQCSRASVPFFFKQWGGPNRKKTGRRLDGKIYDEKPHKMLHLLEKV